MEWITNKRNRIKNKIFGIVLKWGTIDDEKEPSNYSTRYLTNKARDINIAASRFIHPNITKFTETHKNYKNLNRSIKYNIHINIFITRTRLFITQTSRNIRINTFITQTLLLFITQTSCNIHINIFITRTLLLFITQTSCNIYI
jgi:hypothetical protein